MFVPKTQTQVFHRQEPETVKHVNQTDRFS